jgi:hypothetical protein
VWGGGGQAGLVGWEAARLGLVSSDGAGVAETSTICLEAQGSQ